MDEIFGYSRKEIRRQLKNRDYDVDPEYDMSPINPKDHFLEPCIRGSQKILDDPELKEIIRKIYRGIPVGKG